MIDDCDDHEHDVPEGHVLCPRCDGHSEVACRCGGDLCFCANHGDKPCPFCGGECGGQGYVPEDERYRQYVERQAEMFAALHPPAFLPAK